MAKAPRRRQPQHHGSRQLRAVAALGISAPPVVAAAVVARVLRNRRRTSAGSYLLLDDLGYAYVLAETASGTEATLRRHACWLIGLYGSGKPFVPPDARQVEGDILAARRAPATPDTSSLEFNSR